jgi:nicotinamidase-related amidase
MTTALLIIDIQNDYFPGGKMEVEGSVEASFRAKQLLTVFRERRMPIFHMQHISVRPGSTFFAPDTEGVLINANVAPQDGETVIQKNYPNSFRNNSLLEQLKKLDAQHVVIAGMMTHMCVDATTRAAFDYGFQCTVVSDACATRSLAFADSIVPASQVHAAFLAALKQVYAKVVTTAEVIAGFASTDRGAH